MKIIQEGQLPETRVHRKTCNNCRTIFEFEEKEARLCSDSRESYWKLNCPFCKKECYFNV